MHSASLETAKKPLQALITQLQEDKPAGPVDNYGGSSPNKEPTPIKGLKVAVVELNFAEKEALGSRLGKVFMMWQEWIKLARRYQYTSLVKTCRSWQGSRASSFLL